MRGLGFTLRPNLTFISIFSSTHLLKNAFTAITENSAVARSFAKTGLTYVDFGED
ncbi:MAG UNVERIFIED_CONTAM: hypothetical protein LVR29_21395 [Microcystis novacekii LVE1205-3]|jgi:hypothetical protein